MSSDLEQAVARAFADKFTVPTDEPSLDKEVDSSAEDVQDTQQEDRQDEVQQEVQEQKNTLLRDYLKQHAQLDVDDNVTDEDLMPQIADIISKKAREEAELEETRKKLQERDKQLSDYLENHETFQKWRESQQKEKDPPKEERPSGWEPLEFDAEWMNAAQFNQETRKWDPIDKYGTWGINAANNLNKYYKSYEERSRELLNNPLEAVRKAGLDSIIEQVRSEIKEELEKKESLLLDRLKNEASTEKAQDRIDQFFEQNADKFFEFDKGQPKRIGGNLIPTAAGKAYSEAAQYARETLGVKNPETIHSFALREVERSGALKPAAEEPVETPESPESKSESNGTQANGQKKEDREERFLDRVTPPPKSASSREGGRVAAAAANQPDNEFLDFREMILRDPQNEGLLGDKFKG